jgi:predicted RNA-binding Zn ribbon-like protein
MAVVNPDLQLVCDFVNTLDRESGVDELATANGLGVWLRARGLWSERPTGEEAARARSLREALRDLLYAHNGGEADTDAAAVALDEASHRTGVEVRFDAGSVRLSSPVGGVGAVVAAAGQAMVDGSWQSLKACRCDSCRWAFVDGARNHSRRWCSMSVCGNREKARRFRSRRASAEAGEERLRR